MASCEEATLRGKGIKTLPPPSPLLPLCLRKPGFVVSLRCDRLHFTALASSFMLKGKRPWCSSLPSSTQPSPSPLPLVLPRGAETGGMTARSEQFSRALLLIRGLDVKHLAPLR